MLDHIALNENRNAVFIWSAEMCFIFVAQINIIFMGPLYEAVILCDCMIKWLYRNDPKFSDRYAWANSADPDQTAPRGAVWSGSTLFAIP